MSIKLPKYCDIDIHYIQWHNDYTNIKFKHVQIMQDVIHTKLGEGRRVAIPADLCHQFHLEPGDPLVLEPSALGIMLRPLDVVVREVQAYFADIRPSEGLLSEELIRERRAEAASEAND